jgi:glucosylceramidase
VTARGATNWRAVGKLVGALAAFWAVVAAPAAAATQSRSVPTVRGPKVEVVVTSADLHQALTRGAALHFSSAVPERSTPLIDVTERIRYQTVKGLGGAMTDSSAWLLLHDLNGGTRAWLMRKLFGADGIALRFIKVPIGASDFTAAGIPYTYDDLAAGATDPTLAAFSIAHDTAYVIPALRQALALTHHAFVLATPWSPPAWMKTNGVIANAASDLGWLKQTEYGVMAQYFVEFLRAYAAAGVRVNAITPQNEPGQQTSYPGMNMSEADEATFITADLRPALDGAHLHTQIYGYDFNWWEPNTWFARQLAGSPAAADLAGIASHCYFGAPTLMSQLHDEHRALDEVVSECAMGSLPFSTSELEIASIRNWASAVALWNLALDQDGGPVQPPNDGCMHCTGIVTINSATHKVTLTRDYFQLGQVSKFLRPGAVRIASSNFVTYQYIPTGVDVADDFATPGLDDVAFQNRDGSRVLVAYNSATAPAKFAVRNDGYYFGYTLNPGTTATFIWKPRRSMS